MKFVADTNGDGLGDLVWILSGFAHHPSAWKHDNDDQLVDRVCTSISDGTKFKSPAAVALWPIQKEPNQSLML